MLHIHRAMHNLTLAVNAHGHSLVFLDMFPSYVVKVQHISQKPISSHAWFLRYIPDTNAFFIFSLRDLFESVSSLANSSILAMLVK